MESIKAVEDSNFVPVRFCTLKRRMLAGFLDAAALSPFMWFDKYLWNTISNPQILQVWVIFNTAITIYYYYYFVAKFGQTPGKMAAGVKVLTTEENNVSPLNALLRQSLFSITSLIFLSIQLVNLTNNELTNRAMGSQFIFMVLSFSMLAWSLLEFITMLCNTKRRSIHDFIGGTVVVICDEAKNRKATRYVLFALCILNLIIPQLIHELNMVIS